MEHEEFDFRAAMRRAIWVLIACLIVLAVAAVFGGCTTTKYVEVERVRNDTTIITKWQRDSIWLHDSILIKERGDTMLVEKWHTKYVEKQVHDTTYVATHDTIPAPFPQTEYVEKELSWWQRLRIWIGNIGLLGILGVIGYYGVKLWRVYHLF